MPRWLGSLSALCLLAAAPAYAGQTDSEDRLAAIAAAGEEALGDARHAPAPAQAAAAVQAANQRAVEAAADFVVVGYELKEKLYRRHQFWTDAAAVMVYLLTLFGMACAAIQFRRGMERPRSRRAPQPADGGPLDEPLEGPAAAEPPSAGTVKLPWGGEVSSPFLGVILLFLSLGFFYLYLQEVYPVKSIAQLDAAIAEADDMVVRAAGAEAPGEGGE